MAEVLFEYCAQRSYQQEVDSFAGRHFQVFRLYSLQVLFCR